MKRAAMVLLSVGAVAALLCAGLYRSLAGADATWKISKVADEKFLVLLFPAGERTSCQRAVLASLAECKRESIEVHVDGVAVAMPKSDFTPVPPQDGDTYVQRLNQELARWGAETDWYCIQYAMTSSEEGDRAAVTVSDKSGAARVFTYLIRGVSVHPIDVTMTANIPKKMAQ